MVQWSKKMSKMSLCPDRFPVTGGRKPLCFGEKFAHGIFVGKTACLGNFLQRTIGIGQKSTFFLGLQALLDLVRGHVALGPAEMHQLFAAQMELRGNILHRGTGRQIVQNVILDLQQLGGLVFGEFRCGKAGRQNADQLQKQVVKLPPNDLVIAKGASVAFFQHQVDDSKYAIRNPIRRRQGGRGNQVGHNRMVVQRKAPHKFGKILRLGKNGMHFPGGKQKEIPGRKRNFPPKGPDHTASG